MTCNLSESNNINDRKNMYNSRYAYLRYQFWRSFHELKVRVNNDSKYADYIARFKYNWNLVFWSVIIWEVGIFTKSLKRTSSLSFTTLIKCIVLNLIKLNITDNRSDLNSIKLDSVKKSFTRHRTKLNGFNSK